MSDKRKKGFVPPPAPPLPPGSDVSTDVSDASQNAPTRAVSLKRLSLEKKSSAKDIQKAAAQNAVSVKKSSAENVRKLSSEVSGKRSPPGAVGSKLPSPSASAASQMQAAKSKKPPSSAPPPPLAPPPPITPPQPKLPPKGSKTPTAKSSSPSQSTSVVSVVQAPPPPRKSSNKNLAPPPKSVGPKVPTVVPVVPAPRPQKTIRKKLELNANYSILISGTESESDASSIDADAIQKLKELTENETAVFDAVSAGSLLTVKEILDSFQFDFNRRNIVGYTILHISVRRQDEEMVKLVLDEGGKNIRPSVLKDTLLHAIKEVNVNLVRTILTEMDRRGVATGETMTKRRLRKDYLENRKLVNEETEFINSEFHEDITPLKLSAMCDSYELVQLFHDRGHVIQEPEVYVPRTKHNNASKNTDDIGPLRAAYRRLHYFQAISKPAYIAYLANNCSHGKDKDSNCDPMLMAFTLIDTVRQEAEDDVFNKEYLEIADDLQDFACNLIQQCRRTEEVEEILEQAEGFGEISPYPRLSHAIQLQLKQFVAHRHCQQILYRYWAGKDWPEWRVKDYFSLFWNVLLRIFTWPLIAIWMCLDRRSKLGRMMACPASSFLNHLVSYLFFVALVFVVDVYNPDGPNHRGLPRTGVEYAVLVWVAGFGLSIAKSLIMRNRSSLRNPWIFYDIASNCLFLLAFFFWFMAPSDPAIDRKHWGDRDYTLVAEILFSIASTMAYGRLLRIFQLNPRIGPLLTAIGQMLYDVLNALLFFFIIICAFALGLSRLYRPYRGWTGIDPITKVEISQSGAFSSFPKAIESLFWSIFSMGSAGDTRIVPKQITSPLDPAITSTVRMHYVEHTGKIIYSAYHVVVTLILLNMLLCMMSRTYELVNENVDAEWKFSRSKIWLSYGLDFVNPPPFNFIPPISICMKKKKVDETEQKAKYYKLIKILIQRYFRDKAEIASHEPATMESIEALQEDIAEFNSLLEKTEAEQYEREKSKGTAASQKVAPKVTATPLTDRKPVPPPPPPPPPYAPPAPPSFAKMTQNLITTQRFQPPPPIRPSDQNPTSPSSPNVSSIYGDTSDFETEFETVASYERRQSQTMLPPPPAPPFSAPTPPKIPPAPLFNTPTPPNAPPPPPFNIPTPPNAPPPPPLPPSTGGGSSRAGSVSSQVTLTPPPGPTVPPGARNVRFPPGGAPPSGNSSSKP